MPTWKTLVWSPEIRSSIEVLRGLLRRSYKRANSTMPNSANKGFKDAARLTVRLVDHGHTPNGLSEAVLEKLVEMSGESKMNIWHRETGLSVELLTALYRLYETGSGYCHSRKYADYELRRLKDDHKVFVTVP